MENLINKVIEALEMRLGEGYTIISKDKRKNNGLILHKDRRNHTGSAAQMPESGHGAA